MSRVVLAATIVGLTLSCGRPAREQPRSDDERAQEPANQRPKAASETARDQRPREPAAGESESETGAAERTPKQDGPPSPNYGWVAGAEPRWFDDLRLARRRGGSLVMRSETQATSELAEAIRRAHGDDRCQPTSAPADSPAFDRQPNLRPGMPVELVSEQGVIRAVIKGVVAQCELDEPSGMERLYIEATLEPEGQVEDVALALTIGEFRSREAVLARPRRFALPGLSRDELERSVFSQLQALVIAERESTDGSPPPNYELPEQLPSRFTPCRLPGGIVGVFAINHNMTNAFFRKFGTRLYYSALHFIDAKGRVHVFEPHLVTQEFDAPGPKAPPRVEVLATVDLDGDGYDEILYRSRDPDEDGGVVEVSSVAYWSEAQQGWGGTSFW